MGGINAAYQEPHFSRAKEVLRPSARAIEPLRCVTAEQIERTELNPPPFVIEGLLPAGMTIFAAPPKTGKSWFCLDMACAIAMGSPFWGRHCTAGRVLYLDLESRDYRVQSRIRTAGLSCPDNLHFAFRSELLGGGLLEQLDQWKSEHPDTSTIIIDTLGRVKSMPRRNSDAYAADTAALAPVQAWALQNGIAVICVTHLRKVGAARYESDADPFERITGSNAQFGVADTAWIITGRREDAERHFIASGRDIEAVDLSITFEQSCCRWRCMGDAEVRARDNARKIYETDSIVRTVKELLEEADNGVLMISSGDLCRIVVERQGTAGCTPSGMGKRLSALSDGLYRYDGIVHEPPSNGGRKGRIHQFRYEKKSHTNVKQLTLAGML